MRALTLQAGPAALEHIREHGIKPGDVRMMAGASGGAKWLVLSGLDKALVRDFVPGFRQPVHLLGSSIGAWRFGCYAQADPLAAISRFESAYLEQTYSEKPTRDEISQVGQAMLAHILGPDGPAQIVNHPVFRTHIMTVRAKNLSASENTALLLAGLTSAMIANQFSRKSLGRFFERALFHDVRDDPPFLDVSDFPISQIALGPDNVEQAIRASGAIPLVINGVRDIPGAPAGMYRDGGIIDYHFDVPLSTTSGLTLYPHFYPHMTPGWFDKKKRTREPNPTHLDRVLLVSPSAEFVESLPGSKIPDRQDFKTMDSAKRLAAWRRVVEESERLGDQFLRIADNDDAHRFCEPLVAGARR
ncbi:MAG: patatin-like phospholipase family protein [Woeseiaceae bacterium]